MKRVPILLVGSIIAKHCNANNIVEKIRYPSSPKRKRQLLKGNESVDDIIITSSVGIIGEDVYNRDVKKQQRIDDVESLPPLLEDSPMMEIFDDSVEYLESFSYVYDDDDYTGGVDEVSSGLTFTTSTPFYPSRPPSGVWDEGVWDDDTNTLPLACEFCSNGLTVDADTELPTNDGATCSSYLALAATLIQSESVCLSAQRMQEFCCPDTTTIDNSTSSVAEEEEDASANQTYDLCSCSPRTYTIKLSLTQLCNVNDLKVNDGIENTLCIANRQTIEEVENEEGTGIRRDNNMPSKHQLHKMTIIGIQFVEFSSEELTGDLIVINQNDEYSNTTLHDGDVVSFDSISNDLNPKVSLEEQLYLVPGGVQIAIRGMLEDPNGLIEEKIINQHVTWSYTNACDVEPIEAEASIGWVTVTSELTHASEDFCPVASTPPDDTTTTTTEAPLTSAITTTSEVPIETTEVPPTTTTEPPTPDYSMSMMGTKSGKAASKTKAHKKESGMTKAHKQEKYMISKSSKLIQSKSSKSKSSKVEGVYPMEVIDAKAEKFSAQDLPQSKQSKVKVSSVEELEES